MDAVRAFAERAALALLLRDIIAREDRTALYSPFEQVVALTER
jgi:hypothetical protein